MPVNQPFPIANDVHTDLNPATNPPLEAPEESNLEARARRLAHEYIADQPVIQRSPLLLTILTQHEKILARAYRYFAQSTHEIISLSSASEWLLDNYYIVQQSIRQIREDLPQGYYRQLPKLKNTVWKDYPRIYALAHELLVYDQYQLKAENISAFVRAYQSHDSYLTMGELWAFPIMLRLSTLDNLANALFHIIENIGNSGPRMPNKGSDLPNLTYDDMVGRCILSLRLLAIQDWMAFFEDTSEVEAILRLDPPQVYSKMEFETRNSYRMVIEKLSVLTGKSAEFVAHQAISLCQQSSVSLPQAHVGYYLLGNGLAQLEQNLGYRPSLPVRVKRWIAVHPTFVYLGSCITVTLIMVAYLMSYAAVRDGTIAQILAVGLLTLLPAMAISVSVVNWIITNRKTPHLLPRFDFHEGVPEYYQTMVVVPMLLTDEIDSLMQQLELHYLRNTDNNLFFALLSDFSDASDQYRPEDEALVNHAKAGIAKLNAKYKREIPPFYFFHRERRWNPAQNTWMGWERKRGKLLEFNQLLRGAKNTSYIVQEGDLAVLPHIKYVITLDADTVLPVGNARRLIATLAHPLNQAVYDPTQRRVVKGYSILQPRVEIKPSAAYQSRFARLFAGDTGLDLYTHAVSDIYQDFWGEGIYVGKGIYEVDTFERCMSGLIPENTMLSHDLFEGLFARVGLVTDIVLFEDYPAQYLAHMQRLHRWIRGDWQLLPWLLPQSRSPLPLLARWKITDNLRRSLMAPALLALLIGAWLGLPGSPLFWTLVVVVTLFTPLMTSAFSNLIHGSPEMTLRDRFRPLFNDTLRGLFALIFLPFEAALALDAIFTTLVRMFVTHKNLLQWTTAATSARLFRLARGPLLTWQNMISSPVIALFILALLLIGQTTALWLALPFLVLWLVAPQIAHVISLPYVEQEAPLDADQIATLRRLARETWLFFENIVGPEDHWLPPDHLEEAPVQSIAHRTSPTNIGLLLLTTLSAYDLGYIGQFDLLVRLQSTFETMMKLEKHRGHLLNWYNTQTLEPLFPRYVSTVDSGNLAGCLITLKQACLRFSETELMRSQRWQGLLDIFAVFEATLNSQLKTVTPQLAPVKEQVLTIRKRIEAAIDMPALWESTLSWLLSEGWTKLSEQIVMLLKYQSAEMQPELLRDLGISSERVQHHIAGIQRDLELLLPWFDAMNQLPHLFAQLEVVKPVEQVQAEVLPSGSGIMALASAWLEVRTTLALKPPPPRKLAGICETARVQLKALLNLLQTEQDNLAKKDVLPLKQSVELTLPNIDEARVWCFQLLEKLRDASMRGHALLVGYQDLAEQAEVLFRGMDFGFLFSEQRKIFHIGYNLSSGTLDENYYDLLASESRIASFLAIAKRDIPQSHWVYLGRPATQLNGRRVLLSWSGTTFEYLMPSLIMRDYNYTFLTQTCQTVVDYQIAYGHQKEVPWGISESSFYAFDNGMDYQYQAFGAPLLGFKRGLGEELVIAPYASLLGLKYRPQAVVQNINHLDQFYLRGRYGFYEAIDFTRSRLPIRQDHAIVRSYMAHHQGMILVSLANYLLQDRLVNLFHSDPRVQSIELLLQEKIPDQVPIEYLNLDEASLPVVMTPRATISPWDVQPETPAPQVHVLSNGRYSTMITNAGSGYSMWQGTALTRWRPDTTLDNWGTWIYLQDLDTADLWSAGYLPTKAAPDNNYLRFSPHQTEFQRSDHGIVLNMRVTVCADDDVEIRHIALVNQTDQTRRLNTISYAEVLLASQAERHPAFNKLFIESEFVPEVGMMLYHRRPRSADEEPIFMGHLLTSNVSNLPPCTYEGDRMRFLGRGGNTRLPIALQGDPSSETLNLTQTVGATLDPVMVMGQEITLEPHATAHIAYITLAAKSRKQAIDLAEQYRSWQNIETAFDRSRRQNDLVLRQLDLGTAELTAIQQLLSLILYPYNGLRAVPEILANNSRGQSGLWAYGISGDYPILLVRIQDTSEMTLVQEVLRAHNYWRNQQVKIDLVILNLHDTSYSQELQVQFHRLLARTNNNNWLNQRGGIFLLNLDQMAEADRILIQTTARAILDGSKGSISDQLNRMRDRIAPLPAFMPTQPKLTPPEATQPVARPTDLQFDNGIGGFSADGREYVIYLEDGQWTPTPWINVIANEGFGFLVSESGAGYTWAQNSGENRLTPWRNDPVSDAPGEALYLRDEETGVVWSPMPLPSRDPDPYLIHHGAGYSTFAHNSQGLAQFVQLYVVPDQPVKVIKLRLENTWDRPRRVTTTYYAEWVLGVSRSNSQLYIISEYDHASGALLVRNPYNVEFGESVAFLAASKAPHGLTADRNEFLGRMGDLGQPAALGRIGLASSVGPGLDPCAALQIHIDLPVGASEEVFFILGQGKNRDHALELVQQYQNPSQVTAALQATHAMWDRILDTITISTPDTALNLLLNRWLLYQTVSCRIWGRSALYQSSGAFGYRDQLQDVLGVLYAAPTLARDHILRAAGYQFEAGDVLHWWHPPSGRGVRTRFSDDLLWLPYVVSQYLAVTGDSAILNETVPFLRGEPLRPGEDERYDHYDVGEQVYSIYEHCLRAIQRGSTAGAHGLPLMGSGDWNDGMNRVGIKGKGESVWDGWFLYSILTRFIPICTQMGDDANRKAFQQRADQLKAALETNAWDGQWYRRGYYDDGTPLGSAQNEECKIDSIAQSWAVLSGGGEPKRTGQAMNAVLENLVDRDAQLIKLFTPPFDKSSRDPGYIKGYPPGIRENGGQYTHAAIWTVWAFAQIGQGNRAGNLFNLLNPLLHSDTEAKIQQYKVEPYVVAADVYGIAPHIGRGGWTWYTGSASWMYRVGIEAILGFQQNGNSFTINPSIPDHWEEFELNYCYQQTMYRIHVRNPHHVEHGVRSISLDDTLVTDHQIPLVGDGMTHHVEVDMGLIGTD